MKKFLIMILILVLGGGGYFLISHLTQPVGYKRIIENQLASKTTGFVKDNYNTSFDESIPFASKYFFKGNDVNNYFWHQNHCFRIVNITVNGYIKIVHAGFSENPTCQTISSLNFTLKFSDNENSNWEDSNIKKLFDEWEEENKLYDTDFTYQDEIFVDARWYIGAVDSREHKEYNIPINLHDNVEDERAGEEYYAKIGLITLTDYLKANLGPFNSYANHRIPRENYLFQTINNTNQQVMLTTEQIEAAIKDYRKDSGRNLKTEEIKQKIFSRIDFWTLTPVISKSNDRVYTVRTAEYSPDFISNDHSLSHDVAVDNDNFSFNPALYLNNNLDFSGEGTMDNPYIIK